MSFHIQSTNFIGNNNGLAQMIGIPYRVQTVKQPSNIVPIMGGGQMLLVSRPKHVILPQQVIMVPPQMLLVAKKKVLKQVGWDMIGNPIYRKV